MREIKFRGYNPHNNQWYYGDLCHKDNKLYIVCDSIDSCDIVSYKKMFEVETESVGQFIGLKDKNGAEIYEGDICTDGKTLFTIFWSPGGFCIESNPKSFGYGYQSNSNPSEPLAHKQVASWFETNFELVGKIYENSELLKDYYE